MHKKRKFFCAQKRLFTVMNNWQPLISFMKIKECANFTGGERNANI
ncbi:hypothetical protein BLAHAN_06072 [Blautia hansenii DSM 20583]|uniref:Uncharacterized protein n=1 Tax=Blautia hansenii DSM 20583 TaxID=537007 RepID=C9L9I9_BLAHA|nr:hypothetical protein BLAHAN_06072 [Blautia hansenii DSM 20583]